MGDDRISMRLCMLISELFSAWSFFTIFVELQTQIDVFSSRWPHGKALKAAHQIGLLAASASY